MEIISVVPRGYCQGVIRAIRTAGNTIRQYPDRPVTMLGMIVHNRYVVEACRNLGIRFVEDPAKTRLELLDMIDEGVVIFTAHGVSDDVRKKAEAKGLTVVDASCADVLKTHTIVKDHCRHGDVIYIGKKNHPESEGTVSLSPRVHLITNTDDVDALPQLHNILITTQTTLSILDTEKIIQACLRRFPDAVISEEICSATRVRQEAVMNLKNCDVLFVVGDPRSNNSSQLRTIALNSGIPQAYLIETVQDIREDMIREKERIAVTSGSSTPNALTAQVIDFLRAYAETGIWKQPEAIIPEIL